MPDPFSLTDIIEIYRIQDGKWSRVLETNSCPSLLQRLKKSLGLCNYADDALTNYALTDIATYLSTKYKYIGIGIDGTLGTDYTRNTLVSEVTTLRTAATGSVVTTNTTNDTAQFISIITSDGGYTLLEAGLFTHTYGDSLDKMGARQIFSDWPVINAEVFGIIWKIICSRG